MKEASQRACSLLWRVGAAAVLAATWPLVLGACTQSAEDPPQAGTSAQAVGTTETTPLERPYHNHNRRARTAWAGEIDADGQYASVVSVETFAPLKAGNRGLCSGVL